VWSSPGVLVEAFIGPGWRGAAGGGGETGGNGGEPQWLRSFQH
jgi:hypothetical protein